MRAEPAPCMTDFTSAKSRLMSPGVVIRSVMPCTPDEQHLVGGREGLEHAHAAVADLEQAVVGNDDEGVDLALERRDARLGLGAATLALELERPGHDADGQCADRLGDPRDDRCATGSGAAALARGDEHHVGAGERLFDLLGVILGGAAADLGVCAGAEAASDLASDVELDVGVAHEQRLGVGVDGDEFDSAKAELDHPVDGVDTTAADADHLDDR